MSGGGLVSARSELINPSALTCGDWTPAFAGDTGQEGRFQVSTCAESSTALRHGGSLSLWAPNHIGGGPGDAGCPA